MTELLAALVGALFAGGFQFIQGRRDLARRKETVRTAIAAEVAAIATILRHHGYLDAYRAIERQIEADSWDERIWVIDLGPQYFTNYEALASDIGLLQPDEVQKITAFYILCRAAIDATRPDPPEVSDLDDRSKAAGAQSTLGILEALLDIADEIEKLPESRLPALSNLRAYCEDMEKNPLLRSREAAKPKAPPPAGAPA
ncbi:hypothetical protein [Sphingomicrobium aestuariivivum]|uniref:hypothetical protein n=1 Tax=Sphingomicrobium aestuariivivum TaxID=1582356 RepID=UPI001FD68989|nr:hypothetical protein [Sphingomicrobium aestuariivivum]MCJ8191468.1 hypothetical protein [Sphingomicrobium aestuariivivum]